MMVGLTTLAGVQFGQYGITRSLPVIGASLAAALAAVVLGYGLLFGIQAVFGVDFRIWTLAVRTFKVEHLLVALRYLPVFFIYYFVNTVALNANTRGRRGGTALAIGLKCRQAKSTKTRSHGLDSPPAAAHVSEVSSKMISSRNFKCGRYHVKPHFVNIIFATESAYQSRVGYNLHKVLLVAMSDFQHQGHAPPGVMISLIELVNSCYFFKSFINKSLNSIDAVKNLFPLSSTPVESANIISFETSLQYQNDFSVNFTFHSNPPVKAGFERFDEPIYAVENPVSLLNK